jgi:hypothetical protein
MKFKMLCFLTIFLFLFSSLVYATSWNEPWHDEVVKNADSFVFAKIDSFDRRNGVNISIIRTITGKEINGSILVSGFYLLRFTSFSGDKDGFFHFPNATEGFFFIKQEENGNYSIATPTSGFAIVEDGMVFATYRHSYHQAFVPMTIYEETMKAIFNNYHNQPYDSEFINIFIMEHLSQGPDIINSFGNLFFMQHVALESIFHLRLLGYYSEIIPFLNSTNFHDQISAVRALVAYNTYESKNVLLEIINAENRSNFSKVMAIWTLTEFIPIELKYQLIDLLENASTESNGFGGNIMDPRIGTYIPSVKTALQNLIDKL